MLIDSVRIGKKVKLILYQERNYITDGVVGKPMIVLEDNVSNILKKIEALNNPNYTKDCRSQSGYNNPGNSPKVGSMSIVLKQPKPLVPSRIDDDEVVLYLLNDFRGQYLRLKEGDFDSDELTSLFSGRISSIRMGKNMKIKIYENSNYNYVSFANFSTGATAELISPSLAANNEYFTSTGGWEKELYGNVTHNQDREDKTYKQGEIPFLAAVEGVAEGIRSIMVRPLDKDFTDFRSNSDVWNDSAFTRATEPIISRTGDFLTEKGNETDDFFTEKGNEIADRVRPDLPDIPDIPDTPDVPQECMRSAQQTLTDSIQTVESISAAYNSAIEVRNNLREQQRLLTQSNNPRDARRLREINRELEETQASIVNLNNNLETARRDKRQAEESFQRTEEECRR